MKKYCLLFVFLVAALSLRAQIVGDVAVTRKVLAERGGELHMVLEISVSRKAVTRSQSWAILPELSTPDRKSVKLSVRHSGHLAVKSFRFQSYDAVRASYVGFPCADSGCRIDAGAVRRTTFGMLCRMRRMLRHTQWQNFDECKKWI